MRHWPAATLRYVLVGYVLIPLVINVGINAFLGWLLFLDRDSIPVWGIPSSVCMEIIGTGFLLPLITAAISSRVLMRHLRFGMVEPLPAKEAGSGVASRITVWVGRVLQGESFGGCLQFSFVVLPFLAGPALLVLFVFAGDSMDRVALIGVKLVYAGLCGLVVTPLIAISLLDHRRQLSTVSR